MQKPLTEKKYTEPEAAKIIGISKSTVRRHREAGKLRYLKIGAFVFITETHIKEFFDICEQGKQSEN